LMLGASANQIWLGLLVDAGFLSVDGG
jgi:hypothetical protein